MNLFKVDDIREILMVENRGKVRMGRGSSSDWLLEEFVGLCKLILFELNKRGDESCLLINNRIL